MSKKKKRSFVTTFLVNRFLTTKVNSRALVTTAFLNFDIACWFGKTQKLIYSDFEF